MNGPFSKPSAAAGTVDAGPDVTSPAPGFSGAGLACIRGERVVFARLSFRADPGDALLLVGPNGSGKSSLLRLMAGLLQPAAGRLERDGRPVADDPEAHAASCRYVGHLDAVKPVLTVAETLAFWAGLHGLSRGDAAAAAVVALDRFGLGRLATVPGRLLSAGQKRRVNLARLLLVPAGLWLLDEPTVALDRATVVTLTQVLAEFRAGGGMVVLSTHTDIALPGARTLDLSGFTVDPLEALP